MKRLALSVTALLLLIGTAVSGPAIRHSFVSPKPSSSDPTVVDGPKWNADHVIDATVLSGDLGIHIVSGNPNGVESGAIGDLARDTSGQLWVNTSGGTTWVAFLRADGGTAPPQTAWAFLGDSGILSKGVNTDQAVRWNNVVSGTSPVPDTRAVINTTYAMASSEPLTLVDLGTTDLQVHVVGSVPGYGWEYSFGQAMFDLLNGVGATPTAANKIWMPIFGISGVELTQLLPASSYGTATPAFGGLNAYNAWRVRTQALLASSNRKLAGVMLGSLGGNDASNSTDANAVAANMVTLAAQIRSDFGSQVAIIWLELAANADLGTVPFRDTVRAQMVLGASQIPNCRLLSIDSYPMLSDFLHWGADPIWDMGLQIAEATRRQHGIPARTVTQPTIVGYGTPDYNKAAATLAPRGYPLCRHGDFELTFVAAMKTSGTAIASSTWTASGWTLAASGAQALSGETQEFALFARPLTQSDLDGNNGLPPAMSITTGNDENYAERICVRGATLFPSIDGSIVSYAATTFGTGSVNAGGVTTTTAGDLVITFVAGQGGGLSPTENFTVSNATTGASVLIQAPLAQVTTNFGLLAVITGTMATAGATGTTGITPNIVTNPSGFTVAVH